MPAVVTATSLLMMSRRLGEEISCPVNRVGIDDARDGERSALTRVVGQDAMRAEVQGVHARGPDCCNA